VQTVNLGSDHQRPSRQAILLLFRFLRFVGLYELGSRVAFSIRALALTASGHLVPSPHGKRSSGADSTRELLRRVVSDRHGLRPRPDRSDVGVSYVFVLAWVGAAYRHQRRHRASTWAGYAINWPTGVGTALAWEAGRARSRSQLLGTWDCFYLTLTLLLGSHRPVGVVIATALGLVISSAWLSVQVDSCWGPRCCRWPRHRRHSHVGRISSRCGGPGTATTAFAMRGT